MHRAPGAIGYAKFYSRSHVTVIRVYDEGANVIETHELAGDFKEPWGVAICINSQATTA
jgi:hypothetical protein